MNRQDQSPMQLLYKARAKAAYLSARTVEMEERITDAKANLARMERELSVIEGRVDSKASQLDFHKAETIRQWAAHYYQYTPGVCKARLMMATAERFPKK